MSGKQPKQWMKWLSLAEWWYNTNHHSDMINTTPYEMVYGQVPPMHVRYMGGESKVEAVDRTLIAREEAIEVCKFLLNKTQNKMKSQADKQMIDREFEPIAILDRRLAKKGNAATVFVIIQWANGSKEDATREPTKDIRNRFLDFPL
ncbi:retrotransposable element Tf2 [Tanacetum coccineum]|uniref:Retrotransposable element Tf2 n=1 Tax=Tanacetum coccineum TaxID=301880 RepID=A0ABQ4XKH2_9ASTR